jgi:transposase
MLLADHGYEYRLDQGARQPVGRLGQHSLKQNRKEPICFSPCLYRARNLVKRFFNTIKQYRRTATRYDKHAADCPHQACRDLAPHL